MGENKGTTLKPMLDASKISEPFEFDFEYCAVCDVRQYKGELTPPALDVNFLEYIAEKGSYNVISEIKESMEHKEFEQTVKEIKDALDIVTLADFKQYSMPYFLPRRGDRCLILPLF